MSHSIHFYCAIIGVTYTEHPVFTLEIQNELWELQYIPFDVEQKGLFKCVSTFTVRSLGCRLQNLRLFKCFSEYHDYTIVKKIRIIFLILEFLLPVYILWGGYM